MFGHKMSLSKKLCKPTVSRVRDIRVRGDLVF